LASSSATVALWIAAGALAALSAALAWARWSLFGARVLDLVPLDGRGRRSRASELPLEDALQLVHPYAERGSPKFGKAAMRWLERYLAESSPGLQHFAEITASLAKLERLDR
jgi:hypothetical protein